MCVLLVVLARTKAINKENRVLLFFFSLTRNLKLITVQIHVATLLWNVVCNRIQFTIQKEKQTGRRQAVVTVGSDRPGQMSLSVVVNKARGACKSVQGQGLGD